MEYKLFTTRFCHKCPAMKEFLGSQDKVSGVVVDCSSAEGMTLAKEFGVTGVPTVVFVEGGEVKHSCREKSEVESVLSGL
ncbi:thioredoxin family protein [Nanoarchaeota archaeon]